MKGHIPNAITALNLLSGSMGLVILMKGDPFTASLFILIGAIFDFLDGFAARLFKVSSDLGKELDSLADMVTFSLLPSFLMFDLLEKHFEAPIPYLAFLIVISSAFRLARFNLDERQKEHFIGLPTPANAFLVAGLIFVLESEPAWSSFLTEPAFLIGFTILTSFLLNAPISFMSFKISRFGWKGNEFRMMMLLLAIILIAVFKLAGLFWIMISYILFSISGHFMKKQ